MDEVDIENADDLNELEARLYAQIHHEPSGDCDFSATYKEASPVRQVTTTSVINNKCIDKTRIGRYWNDKGSVRVPVKPKTAEIVPPEKKEHYVPPISGKINEQPAETVDKSFRPPVKSLSNLRVNPFASGNGPKTKGSSTQMRDKNEIAAVKSKKNDPQPNKGPFARQITKLANAVKYDAKKQKAKVAKAKVRTVRAAVVSIEVLSSDESDTDDVIEVPLPSPQILTICSSSDDDNTENDESNFLKPLASATKDTSSRCTSPCSVVSDDFIGQNDRSRLLEENEDRPDDEDLLMLQEDVDSLMENPEKSTDKSSESFVAPIQGGSSKTFTTDYSVTQNAFRALDVYESESDIQESVYSRSKNTKPTVVVHLEHESSSDDDVEEIGKTQKTKRLTKRRASSSNKGSETYIDSTDSDHDNESEIEANKSRNGVVKTRVPFIAHGEAIETCVTDEQSFGQRKLNSSDNEFIATLNTLAEGTSARLAAASGNESDEDDESITARAIAENVIRRERRLAEPTEPVTVHDEEANDAIPNDSIADLDQVFSKIDNMNKKAPVDVDSGDTNESVELVAPLPVSGRRRSMKKLEKDTGDPIYNIVYCEGVTLFGGIGWNEEMRKFYNNSWNGDRFNVKAICSRMKTTKSLWKIYTDDRFPRYRKHSNQKCMNCCEFGHIRSKCPKPRKPLVCYMCGERGHHEPRCPNTLCLRCGSKTRMFTKSCNSCNYQNRLICPICKVRGHSLNLCPDKWRRYHSTTKPNEYPNNKVEYKNRKFCCICGCRGHLAEHCRNALRFTEYPLFISEIRSHQKSYDDLSIKTIRSGIGYNLMYKPEEDLSFELAENRTRQSYYGRFLIAVGMGYLLKRKRIVDVPGTDEPVEKQPKQSTDLKEYVVNPFAKAALDKSPSKPTATSVKETVNLSNEVQPVEQADVNEASISSSTFSKHNVSAVEEPIGIDVDDTFSAEPSTSTGPFKTPHVTSSSGNANTSTYMDIESVSEMGPTTSTFKTPDSALQSGVLELVDSDSNYSFSEHFEPAQQKGNVVKAREMEPLPDFIPITDDGDISPDEHNAGISKRYVAVDTDDEENSNMDSSPLPDIPCEAKIYLTNFHSNFLLSPLGNKFLVEKSKVFDVKARLDWTSVGHILVIFGLRVNQDKFHTELLHKFRELSDKLNRKQLENSQKVPKKTDVLIRFLREHLNQLLTNLGNVNDLFKRLTFLENQQTKSGWKSAEKTRRLLNMILIGQAGLRNGSKHLDHLLSHLRKLIDECKEDSVPNEVRDDIDSHWRLIFSSYRHEKYQELVEAYNHIQIKNRFQTINIDPRLLGKKMLDTTLTKTQKDKMEKRPDTKTDVACTEKQNPMKFVPNPASPRYQARPPKTPNSDKKRLKNGPTSSPSVPQTLPSNQKQQKQKNQGTPVDSPVANKIKAVNTELENRFDNMLTKMNKSGPVLDSKAASVFWSREAMKYVNESMQAARSHAGLMEKLSRVEEKSKIGLLSYNDYRAIIKIHNAIMGKQ